MLLTFNVCFTLKRCTDVCRIFCFFQSRIRSRLTIDAIMSLVKWVSHNCFFIRLLPLVPRNNVSKEHYESYALRSNYFRDYLFLCHSQWPTGFLYFWWCGLSWHFCRNTMLLFVQMSYVFCIINSNGSGAETLIIIFWKKLISVHLIFIRVNKYKLTVVRFLHGSVVFMISCCMSPGDQPVAYDIIRIPLH